MIVPASSSKQLARKVAGLVGEKVVEPIIKTFPDGELYVRIPEKDEEITVIGSTHQPDRNWIELLFLTDAALRITEKVKVVIPYYGYGRQDKVFLGGEPLSAEVFARALPVDSFATVEPHFVRDYGNFKIFGKRVTSLPAYKTLGKYLRPLDIDAVVAPDEGARKLGRLISEFLNTELFVFKKRRDHYTGKIYLEGEKVAGDRIVIVDDIIGSGTTMLLASNYVSADKIFFVAVHGVFSQGWTRLKKRGEVIVTDTIQRKESKVSVAGVVAEWLTSGP